MRCVVSACASSWKLICRSYVGDTECTEGRLGGRAAHIGGRVIYYWAFSSKVQGDRDM